LWSDARLIEELRRNHRKNDQDVRPPAVMWPLDEQQRIHNDQNTIYAGVRRVENRQFANSHRRREERAHKNHHLEVVQIREQRIQVTELAGIGMYFSFWRCRKSSSVALFTYISETGTVLIAICRLRGQSIKLHAECCARFEVEVVKPRVEEARGNFRLREVGERGEQGQQSGAGIVTLA
jgi:hypothetical protein